MSQSNPVRLKVMYRASLPRKEDLPPNYVYNKHYSSKAAAKYPWPIVCACGEGFLVIHVLGCQTGGLYIHYFHFTLCLMQDYIFAHGTKESSAWLHPHSAAAFGLKMHEKQQHQNS